MNPESLEQPNEKTGRTVADELRFRLNMLIVMQVVMTLALTGVVWYFARQAGSAHDALCNIRADQVRRMNQTSDILIKHPKGVSGISRKDLETAINNARQTIESLDTLGCKSVSLKSTTTKEGSK